MSVTAFDHFYIDLLNSIPVQVYRYIIPVLYIASNVGNVASALIFSKKSWRKNVCVLYFNFCLLGNTGYINSTILFSICSIGFKIGLQNLHVVLCKVCFYVSLLFFNILPTILVLASIDRLLISSQNVDTRLYSSKRLAYFSIGMGTTFWIMFSLHVMVQANLQEIYPTVFVCYYDQSKIYLEFVSYSYVVFNLLFSLLMIILSVFSFKNVRRIRSVHRQRQKEVRSMTKKDFELLRCLLVQDIVYIVFTIAAAAEAVYGLLRKTQAGTPLELAVDNFLLKVSLFVHHIPYCTSSIIFVSVSKTFRQELKRSMHKMIGKELPRVRENNTGQPDARRQTADFNHALATVVLQR